MLSSCSTSENHGNMPSWLRIWFEFHHRQVKETRILYRIIYNCGRNWYGKVDIFARLLRIFSPWVLGFYFMYLHFQQPSIFFLQLILTNLVEEKRLQSGFCWCDLQPHMPGWISFLHIYLIYYIPVLYLLT